MKILIVLLILFILISIYLYWMNIKLSQTISQLSTLQPGVNSDIIKSDMQMVYDAIDNCIYKNLYSMININHAFIEESSVPALVSGNYRGLIDCLVRTDVFISKDITFFSSFCSKVYLMYLAETSPLIKNIFFKYYSGFTIETYKKKGNKPSVLPFINEYVRNFIWRLSLEIIDEDHRSMQDNSNGSRIEIDQYTNRMTYFNEIKYRELCNKYFNLYNNSYKENTNDRSQEEPQVVVKN